MGRIGCYLAVGILVLGLRFGVGFAQARDHEPVAASGTARVELRDGRLVSGRVEGSEASGFRVRVGSGPPVPFEEVAAIGFENIRIDPAQSSPPFHAQLGPSGQISGRLERLDEDQLRLRVDSASKPLVIRRAGLKALVQRPGETRVIHDGFETLDTALWSVRVGDPSVDGGLARVGGKSLRLPSGGSAITAKLSEPVGSGRLEVAYYDNGQVLEDQRWFVDLTFLSKDGGGSTVRAVPGWTGETMAVESLGGPSLAVQRLLRKEGWHRLSVRFGTESTELTVDGDELAHGPGPGGFLSEIRLATETRGNARGLSDLSVRLDDLGLAKSVEPSGQLEVEPSADEVRFSIGDQLFGHVLSADPKHLEVRLDPEGPPHQVPWSEVSGIYFRRRAVQSAPVQGQLVKVQWLCGPGDDPRDLDSAEGTLKRAGGEFLELDVPFVGLLRVPMDRVCRIEPGDRVQRIVIDPFAHHLGNNPPPGEPAFDPPQAEGGHLEVPFELESVPEGPARLAIDVVDVVGVSGDPRFSADVRAGKYRTHLKVNGQAVDDLNTAVHLSNVAPARVFVPIPPGLLKTGENVLRIEQNADEADRDNLELLGVAVEWPTTASPLRTPQP